MNISKSTLLKMKGLSTNDLADITEEFTHTIKSAEPKAMPSGAVKGSFDPLG